MALILLLPIFCMIDLMPQIQENKIISEAVKAPDTVKAAVKPDTTSQKILLAGDSMAGGLEIFLKKYCAKNHHTLKTFSWTSSTTNAWASKNKLRNLAKEYNPTFVIIVLGSNELFAKDLESKQKFIEEIVSEIPCNKFIWVGPPNWKEDNGFNETIRKVVGNGKYFSSKEIFLREPLKSKRGSDKRHPSLEGYRVWADSVTSWIMAKSDNPIRLEKPIE